MKRSKAEAALVKWARAEAILWSYNRGYGEEQQAELRKKIGVPARCVTIGDYLDELRTEALKLAKIKNVRLLPRERQEVK